MSDDTRFAGMNTPGYYDNFDDEPKEGSRETARRLKPEQDPATYDPFEVKKNRVIETLTGVNAREATLLFDGEYTNQQFEMHYVRRADGGYNVHENLRDSLKKVPAYQVDNSGAKLNFEVGGDPNFQLFSQGKIEGTVFINGSKHEFTDISSEEWREYIFADGVKVRIDGPTMLNVSGNGHRLFDAEGVSHYVPSKWIHIKWKVKPGQPHFVA